MQTIQTEFQKSYLKFRQEEDGLPQSISWKLNIIWSLLQGPPILKQTFSLQQQMQLQDLQGMDKKGLMLIFNSMIKVLFVNEVVDDKIVKIKKIGFLKSWIKSYINFQQEYLCLNYKNQTVKYSFLTLQVKRHNDHKCLQIYCKGHYVMLIKFSKQQSCKAAVIKIQNGIIQLKNQMQNSKFKSYQETTQMPKLQLIKSSLFNALSPQKNISKSPQIPRKIGNLKLQLKSKSKSPDKYQQFGSPKIKKKHIKTDESDDACLSSINIFHELRYKSKRIQITQDSKKCLIHVQMILKIQNTIQEVLEHFVFQKEWNQNIMIQTIFQTNQKDELSNATYVKRVFKPIQNQKPRQTVTKIEFKKLNERFSVMNEVSINSKSIQDQKIIRTWIKTNYFIQQIDNCVKLFFESQINEQNKTQLQKQKSKDVLFQMYKNIIYLQEILNKGKKIDLSEEYKKQISRFFQNNPPVQSQSQGSTQSYGQQGDIDELQKKRCFMHQKSDSTNDEEKRRSDKIKQNYQVEGPSFIPLKSPLDIPSKDYIKSIKSQQHTKDFFKQYFQNQNIKPYDEYVPWYALKKLVEAKYYLVSDSKELECICWQLLQSQKDTLKFLLRQIGANIISGKSILNVSLPVDIFQPRTLLQRSASSYGLAPDLLLQASNLSSLEQIKRVTAFLANATSCELVMQKPFNPILGQTFQGYLKGIPIYYQQTFHNPPISSYFMTCPQFTMYGNLVPYADVGLNTAIGGNSGAMHIKFLNGTHFQCYFPPVQIGGIIYGKRKFRSYNKGYVIQRSLNLLSEFCIQKQKKDIYESKQKLLAGSVIGGIYKVKNSFWEFLSPHLSNMKKFSGITKDHIFQKYNQISGVWFGEIYVDNVHINKNAKLYPIQYAKFVLPSDANYRLDVLYHKMNNLSQSQKQKQVLQNIQRNDRKLREKYSKIKK